MNNASLQKKWDRMDKDQRLLAYAKAQLAEATLRDSIKGFSKENNVGNFWYEAEVTYVYGNGER